MERRVALDLRVSFHEKRGIARYLINFIREFFSLKPWGLELVLLVPEDHVQEFQSIYSFKPEKGIVALPETPIWHWEQFLLPRWCQKNKVDLLHMVTNRGPIFNWGFRKTHVVHDTIGLHQKKWKGGTLKAFLSSTYNRLTIPLSARLADRIITVSNFSKNLILQDLKIPEAKVRVIYNGVDKSFFNPDPTCINKFNLMPNGFVFHLGFLEPRKNTRRVIEAYARISPKLKDQFPLVIAGLAEKAQEVFLPLIKNLDLERNTILLPYVSDQELAGLYSSCAVFVWPSLWEGFGLPVIEAMAAGAPVITSNTTSLPEVAGDAALLVNPEIVEEIRDAIVLLLEKQSLRRELSLKGIKRAHFFQWTKTVEETVKVWRDVLNF